MKILVLVLFTVIALANNSYTQEKTGRERDGLIGAVHKIRLEPSEAGEKMWSDTIYDEKGNKVSREDFDEHGQLGKLTFVHDASGKLLESTSIIGSQHYKTEYSYDYRGNLIAKTNYDGGGSPSLSVYKYDATGHYTETLFYDTKGSPVARISSNFDADGKLTRSTSYDGDGSIKEILIHVYDKNGKEIGTHHLNAKERLLGKEAFDEKGRLVEVIGYDEAGNAGRHVTSYDRYGNVEEILQYDGKGSLEFSRLYKYKVDSIGNWVQKSVSIKDRSGKITSIPNSTATRVIFYY